jgi:[ribosomal protein S5]-alanine N-acetyltransferase
MPFETPRLLVRHFTPEDTAVVYRLSQDEGIKRFMPDQVYEDEAEALGVLNFLIAQYSDPEAARSGTYVQAVELKESGELIGHVGLSPTDGETEIGYAIAEGHQANGYATELVRGTIRWALEHEGVPRVLGVVDSDNRGSVRVLEKAGFALVEERERISHGALALVRTYRSEPGSAH